MFLFFKFWIFNFICKLQVCMSGFSVAKSCLTLCHSMDCTPPCSSVHGISQVRILEWVAISFSRESLQSRDWTHISCIGRQILYQHHWVTTLMAESKEELKSLLMRVKEESETAGLKFNIQKTKIMASGPITPRQIGGEKNGNSVRFFFPLGSQITGQCLQSWGSQRVRHELVTEQQL